MRRLLSIVLCLTLLTGLLASCKQESGIGNSSNTSGGAGNSGSYVPGEFAYVVEKSVPISPEGEHSNIDHLVVLDDKVILVISTTYYESVTFAKTEASRIYSMSMDGTVFAELPNYSPAVEPITDAAGGYAIIAISSLGDGNMWIAEQWSYYDKSNDTGVRESNMLEHGISLRKLDPTGTELFSFDISDLSGSQQTLLGAFTTDKSGNIYMNIISDVGQELHVLDGDGNTHFRLAHNDHIERFIMLSDGSTAYVSGTIDPKLRLIDFEEKALGDTIRLPDYGVQFYSEGGGFDVIFGDNGKNLFGIWLGNNEYPIKLLNWIDSNVLVGDVGNIAMLPDGHIVCTKTTLTNTAPLHEFLILAKKPSSELQQNNVITLAVYGMVDNVSEVVSKFNLDNADCQIQIIDYRQYDTREGESDGLKRLNMELLSGNMPDILLVNDLPYKMYASRGLLDDLYPYIDGDTVYSRNNLLEGAFRATEIDGKLYQMFPSFSIITLVGNPSVVGADTGWNMDEFLTVLSAHPEADMPLGAMYTKTTFLQSAIALAIDEYIDWGTGTAYFDTDDFLQLLKFADTFPNEPDFSVGPVGHAIATGRQLLEEMVFVNFWTYQYHKELFGGELAFKGFPTVNRNGISLRIENGLAITSGSANKEMAWEFLRTFLDKDMQIASAGLPTNKTAFDETAGRFIEENQSIDSLSYPFTEADVDDILAVLNIVSGTGNWYMDDDIWNVISESASDYFNGLISAERAAEIIQSRISILVSERS